MLKTKNSPFTLVLCQFFLLSLHSLFRNGNQNGQVSYGQLPLNPPGWEHSKGRRL
ncbi:hypothetical protein HMPREF3226_00479 [Prevotella corporis]|uniref:Uncharacterized protein n=1 Tax=Prevotella corporis TaxID=28128 RepID=A0A133QKA5_9BACT|nr:hypothetical protein HMPREF3226_00479 [Prevotella corporis]